MTPMEIAALAPQLTEADIAAILHAKAGGQVNGVPIQHVIFSAYSFAINVTLSADHNTHGFASTFAEARHVLELKTTNPETRAKELRAHAEELLAEAAKLSA